MLFIFIILAVAFRLITLAISIKNERKLKAAGAMEFGEINTRVLALSHIAFYLCAITEYGFSDYQADALTVVGLVIYLIGAFFWWWSLPASTHNGPSNSSSPQTISW